MPNMSYCRFRNTNGDLRDCIDAIEDRSPLSDEEAASAEHMADLCRRYLTALEENGIKREADEPEDEEDFDDGED